MQRLHSILLAGVIVLSGCTAKDPAATACTLEAKICPDGSYVGRTEPNCEFAPCPASAVSDTQSVSDGLITVSYSPATFGMAVTDEQVLVQSYIPPCNPDFAYCLYYNGADYKGTNFESAGMGIYKRLDLKDADSCMHAAPEGYTAAITPQIHTEASYATSIFAPLGDAAMGHYANDELYRLFTGSACYEFRTRIAQSQFDNYESGSIIRFTPQDEAAVSSMLHSLMQHIALTDGTDIIFPVPK